MTGASRHEAGPSRRLGASINAQSHRSCRPSRGGLPRRGINTVAGPRTAQALARSGRRRERARKREREGRRSGRKRESGRARERAIRAVRVCERARESGTGARQSERVGQRDDHDARRRAQAARGTGLRAEGSTGPRVTFTGRPRRSQPAMEQPKTPASRLFNTSCIENKDELEEVT